ncbi:hypothetical protein [Paucilactobacillus kaifaensis]|uniref:hypothetical protein n=1 Tax=Paucilactobacillus kaifaensis TaxID=2559921 RepID=UPI0010F88E2D|nr:hypothetical protein [Paucilactobacillus kaifaensis]
MKIISLRSVGLGDSQVKITYMGDIGQASDPTPIPLVVKLGEKYSSEIKIVAIELLSGDYLPTMRNLSTYDGHTYYYKVTTSDGHVRVLPEQSYIAEWADDEGDQDDE